MERNRKKRNYKKERGITLVALIITIIVMLILVAVTVRVVVESDIIGVAEKAAESKETGELKDKVAMQIAEMQLGKYVEATKDEGMGYYIEKLNGQDGIEVEQPDGITDVWYVKKGESVITVYEDGTMITGQVNIWDGSSKEIPETKEGNIYIHNAKQLKYLADSVNGDLEEGDTPLTITADTTVYLMADIDLGARPGEGATVEAQWETTANADKKWTPIGNIHTEEYNNDFKGAFEGNGHVIRGVYVLVEGKFGGIFGNTTNKIQNLIVKDSYIKATDTCVGGIVGAARAEEILNCHNINTYVIGELHNVGGIVGQSQVESIVNCSNSGNIHSNGTAENNSVVGGIVGLAASTVQNCNNSGKVTGSGDNVGGLVGSLTNSSLIENCSNDGIVAGSERFVGGICGVIRKNSVAKMCKNIGPVTGRRCIGGIAGDTNEGTIEKSYNVGTITGTEACIGGICGLIYQNTKGTIQNTYNKGTIIAEAVDACHVGGILGQIESTASAEIYNNYNVGIIDVKGTASTDIGGAIGAIESTGTVNADRNYYLAGVVTPNISHTKETSKTETQMKVPQFVTDLNTGLQEAAWVKTSGYPALIGM